MRCSCELTYWSTNEIKEKRRIAIKQFNNEVLNLVVIQNKLDKNSIIGEHQHIEIDKLDFEILELDKAIKNLKILLEKNNVERSFAEEDIELIEATKEKIIELQAELEQRKDLNMQNEFETFEIFSNLYDKRLEALYELHLKEIKLEELGVSRAKIYKAKKSNKLDLLFRGNSFNNY